MIVPVLATILLRRPPGRWTIIGIIAATVGLAVLSLNEDLSLQSGDLWVLGCALMFALHLITVAHFSPHHELDPAVGRTDRGGCVPGDGWSVCFRVAIR